MSEKIKPLYYLDTFTLDGRVPIHEEIRVQSSEDGHKIVTLKDVLIGFIPLQCPFVLSKCQ